MKRLKGIAMTTATLNIRMPENLKERGMQVLNKEGVSITDLVKDLFCYLEEQQELPEFALNSKQGMSEAEVEKRRKALQSMIGILPSDIDIEVAKGEYLLHKHRPGVRS